MVDLWNLWTSSSTSEAASTENASSGHVNTDEWMYHMDTDKAYGEKVWQQLHKNDVSCIEQIQEAVSHKAVAVWISTTHLKNHPNLMRKIWGTLLEEKSERAHKQCTPVDPLTLMSKGRASSENLSTTDLYW